MAPLSGGWAINEAGESTFNLTKSIRVVNGFTMIGLVERGLQCQAM
ncbi:MAG: hypothetical protein KDA75_20930 [Planctomycetaceae bacterium]|nr:hypothetical protein [Planctomycetaceae bacterium]